MERQPRFQGQYDMKRGQRIPKYILKCLGCGVVRVRKNMEKASDQLCPSCRRQAKKSKRKLVDEKRLEYLKTTIKPSTNPFFCKKYGFKVHVCRFTLCDFFPCNWSECAYPKKALVVLEKVRSRSGKSDRSVPVIYLKYSGIVFLLLALRCAQGSSLRFARARLRAVARPSGSPCA